MNTDKLTREEMRAILRSMNVKGASSMRRPQCETLLADVDAPTRSDTVTAPVVLTPQDEDAINELLPERPRRAAGRVVTGFYVCGFCATAPRHRSPDGAHGLCTADECACGLLNHRPDDKVRAHQAGACGATVEQVTATDPGRAWGALAGAS